MGLDGECELSGFFLRCMNRLTKKERERLHLEQFRRLLEDFPTGNIIECDPLDFIVSTEGTRIGIEHTEYFREPGPGPSRMKMQESMQNRVCCLVRSLYDKEGKPHLNILLSWHPNVSPLGKPDVRATAEKATAMVLANIPNENDSVTIDDSCALPDGLLSILLFRKQGLRATSIGNLRSAGDHSISPDEIRNILLRKEGRLSLYKANNCNEIWLLIVAEGAAPSSLAALDPSTRGIAFCSGFDRVYFYDALNSSIMRLNLNRPR